MRRSILLLALLALLAALALAADTLQDGARAMREGRFSDAERIYRALLAESPGDPNLRLNLGLALHSGRKYALALPEFQAFLKTKPGPGPVHLVLGTTQLKLGKFCDAIASLEQARAWQSSKQVLTELGDAYQGCKRFPEAARTYLAAGEKRAAAHAWWQARDYEQAKPLYAALAASHEQDPEFLYEYGDTLARIESAEAAIPFLERSVNLAPQLIPARAALGKALLEAGQPEKSIPHLTAAAPSDVSLLLPLSRAYKATGRLEEAARLEAEYRKQLTGQN